MKLVGYRCDIDEAKRVVTEAETGICEQEIRMDDMDTNGVNVDSPMFAKINVGVGGGVKFAKTDSGVKISGKSRSKVLEVSELGFLKRDENCEPLLTKFIHSVNAPNLVSSLDICRRRLRSTAFSTS